MKTREKKPSGREADKAGKRRGGLPVTPGYGCSKGVCAACGLPFGTEAEHLHEFVPVGNVCRNCRYAAEKGGLWRCLHPKNAE